MQVTHLLVPPSHSGCSVLSWSLPGLPPPPHQASDGHADTQKTRVSIMLLFLLVTFSADNMFLYNARWFQQPYSAHGKVQLCKTH